MRLPMESRDAAYKVEKDCEYDKWCREIPYIKFDPEWEVKIIPPFAGAIVRYQIKNGSKWVSVYLDCYDNLGIYGEPYWEVYPVDDNNERVDMEDVDGLMRLIRRGLE